MDGVAHVAGDSPEADRASSSAPLTNSASRHSRPRKGIHLRRRWRLLSARRGDGGEGDGKGAGDDVQDLALLPGMSFAGVLAQLEAQHQGPRLPGDPPRRRQQSPRKGLEGDH
ncbi:hypothetical protein ACQJBY_011836 [Aegilops geniculata]